MNKKKLGIFLLLAPIIIVFLIVLSIVLSGVISFEVPDYFLEILIYIVFPLSISIGILLLIKHRDKHKSFISSKVSKKRSIIGKIILLGIICPILIYIAGSIVYLFMGYSLREKYSTRCESCSEKALKEAPESSLLEPSLIGNYEYIPDEYVWYFDIDNYGYFELNKLIDIPQLYLPKQIYSVKESWNLKNNYKLDLVCDPVDITKVGIGDSFKCNISYNNKVIDTNVRHDVFCYWKTNKSCIDNIGVILYSNRYSKGDVEYLSLISREDESHNKLSVYKLENGEILLLPFKYEYKGENFSDKSYTVSGTQFELYGIKKYGIFDMVSDGDMELVTFFDEPTMGYNNNIAGIHDIWKIDNDGLYLRKSVMELIEDWNSDSNDGV